MEAGTLTTDRVDSRARAPCPKYLLVPMAAGEPLVLWSKRTPYGNGYREVRFL